MICDDNKKIEEWYTKQFTGGKIKVDKWSAFVQQDINNQIFVIFNSNFWEESEIDMTRVIAHEALHVTKMVMTDSGISLNDNSEDSYCYFIGYVVAVITKEIKDYDNRKRWVAETRG